MLIPVPELELNWLNLVRVELKCSSLEFNSELPSTELKSDIKSLISFTAEGLQLHTTGMYKIIVCDLHNYLHIYCRTTFANR